MTAAAPTAAEMRRAMRGGVGARVSWRDGARAMAKEVGAAREAAGAVVAAGLEVVAARAGAARAAGAW